MNGLTNRILWLVALAAMDAVIRSQAGQPCRLRYGNRTQEVKIAEGGSLKWTGN